MEKDLGGRPKKNWSIKYLGVAERVNARGTPYFVILAQVTTGWQSERGRIVEMEIHSKTELLNITRDLLNAYSGKEHVFPDVPEELS